MRRFVVAGLIAGVLLLSGEVMWLRLMAAQSSVTTNEGLFFVGWLGALAGALGAWLGAIAYSLARGIDWVATQAARRRGRPLSWVALLTGAASAPLWAYLVVLGFAGRGARSLSYRELVMAGAVAALTGATVLTVVGAGVWLARVRQSDAVDSDRRPGHPSRAGGVLFLAGIAVALFATDRGIFPHLYPAFHLCLRLGMFAAAVAALLLAGPSNKVPAVRDGKNGSWIRILAGPTVLASLAFLGVGMASPIHRGPAALRQTAYSYGRISESLVDLADSWSVRTRKASSAPSLAAVIDASRPPVSTAREERTLLPDANILLVTVDALRADHMGAYGYGRPTSPVLDALARDSIVFERAYATTPHTSFALTSLLIGKPAFTLAHLGELEGQRSLADYTRDRGYETAAFFPPAVFFVEPERFRSYEASRFGFEKVEIQSWPEETSATELSDRALEYLRGPRRKPFCLWLHYFAPHEPYVDHLDLGISFGRRAVDRYDGEIRWVDREIGRVLDFVRKEHPRTIIVVTADHGEEFGEHGGAYHGTTLFDEQIRVPLLVYLPRHPPARIKTPISTVDLLPTVLSLVGIPWETSVAGRDLSKWLAVERQPDTHTVSVLEALPVFAENNGLKMVVAEDHKLVCDVRRELCMLYDLARDPKEREDVSRRRPQVRARLDAMLRAWLEGGRVAIAGSSGDAVPDVAERGLRRAALADRGAVPDLLRLLSDPSIGLERQRGIARALALLVGPDLKVNALLREIHQRQSDALTSAWTAIALARLGNRDAAMELLTRYDQIASLGPDLAVQTAVAVALAGLGDPIILGRLLDQTEDVNLRCALMDGLGRTGGEQAGIELVRHYDVIRSRICCAKALRRLASPGTLSFILSRVTDEPYLTVQMELLHTIGKIGDMRAAGILRQVREHTLERQVADASEAALRALDDRLRPKAVKRRLQGQKHPSRRAESHWERAVRTSTPVTG